MDIPVVVAVIASLTTLLMAFINYRLSRSSNRTAKKTEVRAQSYIDFIKSISELAHANASERKHAIVRLSDAKARIAVYGDSAVVRQLAIFDRTHNQLNSDDAYVSFMKIVVEMRNDAIGKRGSDNFEDLKQIIFGSAKIE